MAILLASIGIAIIMLVPGLSPGMTSHAVPSRTYEFGSQRVTFTGDHVTISFGKHTYDVSWTVYMANHSHMKKMNLSNISYSRIHNKYQNSAIMRVSNSYVKVAEIFSFGTAIHASIAIKNLLKSKATFEVVFYMKSGNHSALVSMNGYDPIRAAIPHGSSLLDRGSLMIPSKDWSLSMCHIGINWRNEASLFHAGLVSSNQDSSSIALPFGPITIMGGETYSIDPIIRPLQAVSYAFRTDGVTSGSPPSGAHISSYTDHAYPFQTIYVNATISSAGSGGDTWYLEAYNYTGGIWETLESSSLGNAIAHEFIFTLPSDTMRISTNLNELRVYVRNDYGESTSNYVKFYTMSNYPMSIVGPIYYNSNGKEIGHVVATVRGPPEGVAVGQAFGLMVNPTYVPDRTFKDQGVNWVNQSITYDNTSANKSALLYLGIESEDCFFYQDYSSVNPYYVNEQTTPLEYLLTLANPIAMAMTSLAQSSVTYYLAMVNKHTRGLQISQNGYSNYLNYSAGDRPRSDYISALFGEGNYINYYSLGTSSGTWYAPKFTNSYTFPIHFSRVSIASNALLLSSDPAFIELTYSAQMGITLDHTGLFSGPAVNLPFYLGYYDLTST